MTSPFKTKAFKDLFETWNKILEDAGHIEIENFSLAQNPLKTWSTSKIFQTNKEVFNSRLEYFSWAREMLQSFEFKNSEYKTIWELHSEGLTIRKIASKTAYSKSGVFKILFQLKKEMLWMEMLKSHSGPPN